MTMQIEVRGKIKFDDINQNNVNRRITVCKLQMIDFLLFFMRNFSWQFLFGLRLLVGKLVGVSGSRKLYIFFNHGLAFNKPTHYVLDYEKRKS